MQYPESRTVPAQETWSGLTFPDPYRWLEDDSAERAAPGRERSLAEAAWATCQAHTAPYVEDYFVPWHRAYVLYFEDIVRTIADDGAPSKLRLLAIALRAFFCRSRSIVVVIRRPPLRTRLTP